MHDAGAMRCVEALEDLPHVLARLAERQRASRREQRREGAALE
jgi:hypothetical protein